MSTITVDRVELARHRALEFAQAPWSDVADPAGFADEYAFAYEEWLTEIHDPDLPFPTPEEVWGS
jgi:hypothetical protein